MSMKALFNEKTTNIMKRLSVLIVSLAISVSAFSQIKAVEDFIKKNPDLDAYYIYQSTLRLLNPEGNEDFNMLIKDVRKINAYVSEGANDVEKQGFSEMMSQLEADGFELLIKAKYDSALVNFMGKDAGRDSYFVLGVHDEEDFALLEMDGAMDLSYLNALHDVDFSKLNDIILDSNSKNVSDQ